jgi:hypothetical protein
MTPFTKNMDFWFAVPSAFAIETFLKNNDIYGEISWAAHSQQSAGSDLFLWSYLKIRGV